MAPKSSWRPNALAQLQVLLRVNTIRFKNQLNKKKKLVTLQLSWLCHGGAKFSEQEMKIPPEKLTQSQISFVEELTAIQGQMRYFCTAIMIGQPGVEDIIQESNRVILEKADEFELGTNFRAWVFSIVRFQVMAHFKRAKRGERLIVNSELTQMLHDESIEAEVPHADSLDALRMCLSLLRNRDAELVMKRYGSQETLAGYSLETGRTVNALKRALYRIRKQLKECITMKLAKEGQNE